MPRYIDTDALKQPVGSYNPVKYTYEYGDVITVADIDSAPTADVVERKKGKWIQRSDTPFYYYCSNCHRVISITSVDQMEKFHAFCGTCGADMREEAEDVGKI